jgi:nicotinamidase/pyrazinamidase
MQIERDKSLLLIVDLQPDFLPGGALAVSGGDAVLAPLRALMNAGLFRHYAGTQDWHPPGHISFASSHPGRQVLERIELYGREQVLWPDHCVQGTPGAELVQGMPWEKLRVIVRKGTDREVDSYSAFRNNWDRHGERPTTGLAGYLRDLGIEHVYLAGLARDFCVKWSAEDACEAGFKVHVLWDLTRPVFPESDAEVREALTARGAHIMESAQLMAGRST